MDAEHSSLEPLIGYEEIKRRHLFGLPLVSAMKDPTSGRPIEMTPEMVRDIIEGAVATVEQDCHIELFPVQHAVKLPFDRTLYESFGFVKLPHRPVASIEALAVTPSNNINIYSVPLDWVETSYLPRGQLNLIPLTVAFGSGSLGTIPATSTGGAFFLSILGQRAWVPAFWKVTYTTGFAGGLFPRMINELIGTVAAQEILSMLAATYARNSSFSLSIDGLGQSVSTPGPNTFTVRSEALEMKRKRLTGQVRAKFGTKLFSGTL